MGLGCPQRTGGSGAVYVYVEALLPLVVMKTHVPVGETESWGGEKWALVGDWAA